MSRRPSEAEGGRLYAPPPTLSCLISCLFKLIFLSQRQKPLKSPITALWGKPKVVWQSISSQSEMPGAVRLYQPRRK